jgi:cell division protein ZapA
MAQVSVTINGRSYPVACNDGEEQRIGELARYIDEKVRTFAQELGQIGETRLLVLAALMLADELAEAQEAATEGPGHSAGNGAAHGDGKIVAGIETLASRIEAIAAKLEAAHI